ncbi:myosin light chain kinase 2, skeletal/cardiac muscle isoform X2 [Stigmatopora argus]
MWGLVKALVDFASSWSIWLVTSMCLLLAYICHNQWNLTCNSTQGASQQLKECSKDGTERPLLTPKPQNTMKQPHTEVISDVQKLNQENAEKSAQQPNTMFSADKCPDSGLIGKVQQDSRRLQEQKASDEDVDIIEEVVEIVEEVIVEEGEIEEGDEVEEEVVEVVEEITIEENLQNAKSDDQKEQIVASDDCEATSSSSESDPEVSTAATSFETEELVAEEYTEVLEVQEEVDSEEEKQDQADWAVFKTDGVEFQFDLKKRLEQERKENKTKTEEKKEPGDVQQYFIDTSPPPAAPFNHRIVSAKPNQISNFYTINWQEVLGGGRFGQVHKCVENSSGLTLAAKVIKAKSQKEKEVVKNEIQVMNNLDHPNLIQLYASYESRNDIILVLEYVGGGELFDRIIDENYTLMELDAVVFIRQICEGLQHMHKMYILHLDLKPENILCVSRVTNKIKIIDFGLARIYKPREKLRVNFGTPEFLAPEVINYDFVSFNTDMWSLGVITYMLLSGLCPFLGDDNNETLNNILACQWNFEEQEFVDTSEEAKDFITRLLVVNKSWRMGASEALKHPWLSDASLHHNLNTKKTMCRSRRSSCVPSTDS